MLRMLCYVSVEEGLTPFLETSQLNQKGRQPYNQIMYGLYRLSDLAKNPVVYVPVKN